MYINSAYETSGLQLLSYDVCSDIAINFNEYSSNLRMLC